MKVGVLVEIFADTDVDAKFAEVRRMGMESIQLVTWNRRKLTDAVAAEVNQAAAKHGIHITAFWCGWEGPKTWDFYEGPMTLGLVPEAFRFERLKMILEGCSFAAKINVRDVVTHVGFMPENPNDPKYAEIISVLKVIARKCKENNQNFLFETGQETPVVLLRAINDIGMDNVGINLDPANLIMYGKGNPIDALDVFGQYVWGVHGKDGCYPTDGYHLGKEMPLGEGAVSYESFIAKLKSVGYQGDITIEREISGEKQKEDILHAKKILDSLINTTWR